MKTTGPEPGALLRAMSVGVPFLNGTKFSESLAYLRRIADRDDLRAVNRYVFPGTTLDIFGRDL
jgi:hypothetical protein